MPLVRNSNHDDQFEDLELPYFVYGTLRPYFGNDRFWRDHYGVPSRDGEAFVRGFQLYSSGIPYAVPSEDPADRVIGCLVYPHWDGRHSRNLRQSLDGLEGWPRHYDRRVIAVETDGAMDLPIHAWIYTVTSAPIHTHLVPSGDYGYVVGGTRPTSISYYSPDAAGDVTYGGGFTRLEGGTIDISPILGLTRTDQGYIVMDDITPPPVVEDLPPASPNMDAAVARLLEEIRTNRWEPTEDGARQEALYELGDMEEF